MALFSASRYVNGITSRERDRQLFSLPFGIGPLTDRAGDAAFAREGNRS